MLHATFAVNKQQEPGAHSGGGIWGICPPRKFQNIA